jgi:glycerophosphoryl diester phosphodiesterase
MSGSSPLIVAHQGSSEGVVPGTLAAYVAALEAGAEVVEADIRRTRDGALLCWHDDTLGGTPFGALTAAEIEGLAPGRAPALAELLALVAGQRVGVMLDLKEIGRETEAVDLAVGAVGLERVLVSTLEDESVAALRRERPEVEVGLSLGRGAPQQRIRTRASELYPLRRARRCDARFLSVHHQLARYSVLRQTRRAGIPVHVWTVDEPALIARFLRDDRISGLITNRPATALALRAAR